MTADLDLDLLARTWHLLTDHPAPREPGDVAPSMLLPGTIDEPLLRTIDEDGTEHVLSNVCTACGSIVVERARAKLPRVRCVDCDREHDASDAALVPVSTGSWGPLRFASLRPSHALRELLGPLPAALADRRLDAAVRSQTCSRDFVVGAHWLAYVEDAAAPGTDHPVQTWSLGLRWPDRWILVPGTIVDVHPWGLSVRAVQPLSPRATRVVLETWICDQASWSADAPADVSDAHYAIERRVVRRARGRLSHAHRSGDWTPPPGVQALRALLASVLA